MTREETLASARFWLRTMKIDPGNVVLVRRRLREAGATPEDIGTTEAALNAAQNTEEFVVALREEVLQIEQRIATNSDKVIALAKRIVEEGLESNPDPTLTSIPHLGEQLADIQNDAERLGADPDQIIGELKADQGDDEDGDTILEQATRVVQLTKDVFAWANGEDVKDEGGDEPFSLQVLAEQWKDIVSELGGAGSGLADLGLDDACLTRLQEIAALRPATPPAASAAA